MKKVVSMFLVFMLLPVFAYAGTFSVTVTTDKPTYQRSQQVVTTAEFRLNGSLYNTSNSAKITIKDPGNSTRVNAVSMTKVSTGIYRYTYTLSSYATYGTWTDTCSLSAGDNSGSGTGTFTVAAADTTAPTTSATPVGGTYTSAQSVTLTANEPATIYYTTNGSTPTTASAVYSAPLNIAATTTLQYFARDTAGNSEAVKTQLYTISSNTHTTLTWSGYAMCSSCHNSQAQAMYQSVHYQWRGSAAEWTTGPATQGKMDATDGSSALNAYCINIQGSWTPCGACHAGTGAKPVATATPSAAQLASIDCLMCHADATNAPYSRVRNATTGLFEPTAGLDMNLVVQKVGKPSRKNCLGCHAKAGGGDAVKRGDIAIASGTTADVLFDTHMATGQGGDIKCQGCHTFTNHRVAGRGSDLRPEDTTAEVTCATTTCHPTKNSLTSGHTTIDVNHHTSRVACQSCHIPKYAKNANDTTATEATEMHRDWQVAEWNATLNRYEPTPTKANDQIPRYAFWNGTSWGNNAFDNAVLDSATNAYKISRPNGAITDPSGTKLYPFKYKTASQALANGKLVTPKVSTYFATGNYDQAVQDGLVYMGMAGAAYATVTTDELQVLNHQVPTAAGNVLSCSACHPNTTATRINLKNLGYVAKKPLSDLCNDCHSLKTYDPANWSSFHREHHESRSYDCSNCHNFSRAGEY